VTEHSSGAFISFDVLGHPEPAGSKRAVPSSRDWRFRPGVRWNVLDANPKSDKWKKTVRQAAQNAVLRDRFEMFEVPCWMFVTFLVNRPQGHFLSGGGLSADGRRNPFPAKKPDLLKLMRAVEDALTGVVYKDDALIVSERMAKRWTDGPEMVTITVSRA
jgi:Holliday junction resolvase RusA-like endonuclease